MYVHAAGLPATYVYGTASSTGCICAGLVRPNAAAAGGAALQLRPIAHGRLMYKGLIRTLDLEADPVPRSGPLGWLRVG
jgi:hypothetical protein